jgi:hypothetical protein
MPAAPVRGEDFSERQGVPAFKYAFILMNKGSKLRLVVPAAETEFLASGFVEVAITIAIPPFSVAIMPFPAVLVKRPSAMRAMPAICGTRGKAMGAEPFRTIPAVLKSVWTAPFAIKILIWDKISV